MTDASLQDAIEDDYETELSRLGSSKALYALTEGEMDTDAVLAALADRAETAAETFEGWSDEAYGDLFATTASTASDHAEQIAGATDGLDPTDAPTPPDEALRGLDESDARLGGLLAWTLVTDRTLAQAVGFCVGNADTKGADLFRGLRSDVSGTREEVLALLPDADENDARDAAGKVVEAAYGHYVETLEGLGIKVKPVC